MERKLSNITRIAKNTPDYDLSLKTNVFKRLRSENILLKDYINQLENRIILLEGFILEKEKKKL